MAGYSFNSRAALYVGYHHWFEHHVFVTDVSTTHLVACPVSHTSPLVCFRAVGHHKRQWSGDGEEEEDGGRKKQGRASWAAKG